ncbi:MAG: OmpA family protein [Pyrinomonadaceae bacterium]
MIPSLVTYRLASLSLPQKAYNFFVKVKVEGECAAVNDSDRYPKKLPPDDFSKTTPSIRIPREDLPPPREDVSNDWEKTNYNYSPKQSPPADEWGKTAHNINVPRDSKPNDDFGKTYAPGRQPQDSDWGATQANINLPSRDYGKEDFGGRQDEPKATMPYFQLPEAERAKYQNLPPVNSEAEKKDEKKGGIPSWLWASGGLAAMFIFAAVVLLAVYFLFIRTTGFDVIVKGTQPGSEIFIDNSRWGASSPTGDGSVKLPNIAAGQRKITIKHAGFADDPHDVEGKDGETKEVTAQQRKIEVAPPPADDSCKGPFKPGEEAKAAQCANQGLDKLGDDFSVQDLLNAMNLYIIKFDNNSAVVKDADKPFLQKAAGLMKKLAVKAPNIKIQVGGHTDNVGSDASNQPLSESRAKSVHDLLVGFGVNPNMLETQGYGSKVPVAPNDTPEHKFQNRRIAYKAIMN